MELNKLFNQSKFQEYAASLQSGNLSNASIKRKLSSLSSFENFLVKKQVIVANTSPASNPVLNNQKIKTGIKLPKFLNFTNNVNFQNKSLFRYLTLTLIILAISGLSYGIYLQTIVKAKKNFAYSTITSPVRAGRYLSFQGRLTDTSGNPINSSIPITFKLYDTESVGTGTSLYSSSIGNSQAVTPDENGIFNVVIGKTHGTEIPSSVFTENPAVFLEITAGGETMSPRQPIATVAYAINAETLQGMPPSASGLKNTVMVIDNQGNLNLGETSPSIKSVSGTMGIEGQALLLKASDGSGGNIEINPDASGIIKLTTEGVGSTAVGGFISASNANLATGNLFNADIRNTNRGYNFIEFRNYNAGTSTLATRFSVSANGNVFVGSTLSTTNISIGNTLINASAAEINLLGGLKSTNGSIVVGNGSSLTNLNIGASGYVLVSNGSSPAWVSSSSVGQIYTAGSGLTLTGSNQFKLGGLLTEDMRLNIGSTEVMFLNLANGNIGLGTTSPGGKLEIAANGNALKISSGYIDIPVGTKLTSTMVANDLLFYLPLQTSIASSRSNLDNYSRSDTSSGSSATYTSDSGWITHDYVYNNVPRFERTLMGHGVWVENGRRNLLQYQSFEDGGSITGWTNTGLETFTTTGSYRKHQSIAAQIADSNATGGQMTRSQTLTSGQTYPFYCYVLNNNPQRGVVDSSVASLWANGNVATTYTPVDGGWYKLSGTVTGTGAAANYGINLAANKSVFVDGCQIEADYNTTTGVPYATTMIYNDSTNQRNRGEETLSYYVWRGSWGIESSDYILDANKGTVSFWIKPEWAANQPTVDTYLMQVPNVVQIFYQASTDQFVAQIYNGTNWTTVATASAVQNFAANTDHYISLRWDATNGIALNVDGKETAYNGSWTAQTNQISTGTLLYVGSKSTAGGRADSLISDFGVFNRKLTANEVAQIYLNKAPIEDYQRNDLITLQQNNRNYQRGNIRITGTVDAGTVSAGTLSTTYLSSAYFGVNNAANFSSHAVLHLPFQNNIDGSRKEIGTFTRADVTQNAATSGDETSLKLVNRNHDEPRIDRGYISSGVNGDTSNLSGNFGINIEEGRKNVALNSSFESMTGWSGNGTVVGAQTSAKSFHGTNSVNLTSTGAGRYFQTLDLTGVAAATLHQVSVYVYRNEANAWGGTIDNSIASLYARTDDTNTALATTYIPLGNGWYRLVAEFSSTQANNWDVGIALPSSGRNVYVDAFQVERLSNDASARFPSSYIPTNGTITTRAPETLSYPLPSSFKSEKGGVSFWFKPNWTRAIASDNTDKVLFMIPNVMRVKMNGTSDRWDIEMWNGASWVLTANTTGLDVSKYNWNHLACGWYYNYTRCYLNGSSFSSGTSWTPQNPAGQQIYIGSDNTGANQANAQISSFTVFDTYLTPEQMIQLYYNKGKFEDYYRTDIAKLSANGTTATQEGSLYLTGNFRSGSGTPALPSFSFNNDTDTGIFNPSANTIALVTNANEALRVASNGNVGIGTTDPGSFKLNVNGNGYFSGNLQVGGTFVGDGSGLTNVSASSVNFANIMSGTNNSASMNVGTGASLSYTGTGVINASNLNGYSISNLPFVNDTTNTTLTRSGSGPYTLSLNLGSTNTWTAPQTYSANSYFPGSGIWNTSGSVGIGTTAPAYKLDVAGTGRFTSTLQTTGINNQTNNIAMNNTDITGINNLQVNDGGPGEGLSWADSNWLIDTSPLDRSNATGNLNLYGTANNVAIWRPTLWVYDASNYATATALSNGGLNFSTTGSGNISLTPGGSGYVGIGTTGPTKTLEVNGDALLSGSSRTLQISNSGTAFLNFSNSSNAISYAGNQFAFTTNQSQGFTFNGGNVGLGNTNPGAYRLNVTGNEYVSGNISIGGTFIGDGSGLTNVAASSINFQNILTGTNTQALMTVGTGSSLTYSGTGIINATQLQGASWASPLAIGTGTSNAANFSTLKVGSTASFGSYVGIGTTKPIASLDVFTGATTNNTVINAVGSINDFFQMNIQNTSTGTGAQSGYSVTADNGTNTTNFMWMGINNSSFNNPQTYNVGYAGDASILSLDNDLLIANGSAGKKMHFYTGGTTDANRRMTIDGSGNIGIGITNPTSKLQIAGGDLNLSFNGSWNSAAGRNSDKISLLSSIKGRQINDNPDFMKGLAGYSVYDNNSSGQVTFSLIGDTTAPNASAQIMQITVGNGVTSPSPGFGGFYKATSLCTTTAVGHCMRIGNRNIIRIWAKIPSGYAINFASNSMGTGGNQQWLTSTNGTGNWEEYVTSVTMGPGASSTDFFYISGSTRPVTWYVAQMDMIDTDQVEDTDRATSMNVGYKLNVNLGTGQFLNTNSAFLATDAGSVGIGLTNPLYKLHVSGDALISTRLGIGATNSAYAFNVSGNGNITAKLNVGTTISGANLDLTGRAGGTSFKVNSNFTDLTNNAPWYGLGYSNLTLPGSTAGNYATQLAGYWGLNFQTAGSQMVFNQAGNLGVGTTNPGTYRLNVSGNGNFTGNLNVGGTLNVASIPSVSDNNLVLTSNSGVVSSINTTGWDKNSSDDYSYWNLQADGANNTQIGNTATVNFVGGTNVTLVKSGNTITINNSALPYTVSNGLTLVGQDIQLGGTLNKNTDINLAGNSFTLSDSGTTLASFNSVNTTFNNPVNFGAAGDVSLAYDLYFNNSTSAFIKSQGPLYIQTENPTANLDLTLSAANAGQVIIDDNAQVTGNLAVGNSLSTTNLFVGSTALVTNLNSDQLDGYNVSNLPFVNASANGTLTRSGVGPYSLALNLANANSWTGAQTFTNNTYFPGSGIWKSNGNVGIGTTAPGYKLHVAGDALITTRLGVGATNGSYLFNVAGDANLTGNLAIGSTTRLNSSGNLVNIGTYNGYVPSQSSSSTNSIISLDSRGTNYLPQDRAAGLYADFKANATDGLSDGGSYHGSLTFRSYGAGTDLSGGQASQIAYTDNGGLWTRLSTSTTTWGSWRQLATNLMTNNFSFMGNLGIGTTSTSTYRLNVAGNAYISGNLSIGGTYIGDGSGLTNITVSALSFDKLTTGTNTQALMTVGAGSSLSYTSTGMINASQLQAATWASPLAIGTGTANTGIFSRLGVGATDTNYSFHTTSNGRFDTNLDVGGTLNIGSIPSVSDNNLVLTSNSGVVSSINTTGWDKNSSDDYSYWNLQANGTNNSQIGNTATVNFVAGIGVGITKSGNTITINNTSSPYTASNGLTKVGYDIQFGGSLTKATDLNLAGNIFTISDSGSNIATFTATNTTFNNPVNFASSGDVSVAYDLNFTNPTASFIKSAAPLYLQAGESFNSSDLTLRTFNSGRIVFDAANLASAQAQNWTLASSAQALNINAGLFDIDSLNSHVGIGTTAPKYSLDVQGDALVSTRLGVGATNSSYTFNVSGNGNFTGNIAISGTNAITSGRLHLAANGSVGAPAFSFSADTNNGMYRATTDAIGLVTAGVERIRLAANGKIGIGTTAPGYQLHVNGDALIATRLGIGATNGSYALNVSGNGNFTGNLNVGGTMTVNTSTINTEMNIGGQTSNGLSHYQFEGATYRDPNTFTPTLLVRQDNASTGIAGFKPALSLYNNDGSQNSTVGLAFVSREQNGAGNSVDLGGIMGIKESVGNSGAWSQGGLAFFTNNFGTRVDALRILTGGNIGVGTTNPLSKLDIAGTQQAAMSSIQSSIANNAVSISYARGANGGFEPGYMWYATDNAVGIPKAGTWIQDTNSGTRLFMGTSNNYAGGITNAALSIDYLGNVGIGNTNPGKLLTVGSNMTVDSSGNVSAQKYLDINNTKYGLVPSNSDPNKNSLSLYYSGSIKFNIDDSTSSPTNIITAASSRIQNYSNGLGLDVSSNTTAGATTTWNNNLFLNTSGFMGIGTTAPGHKLVINGGHSDTRLLLHSTGDGGAVNTADLMLWASEPGQTYYGVGIANNIWNSSSSPYFTRINTNRGGSYLRLLDNSMNFNLVDSAGTDTNKMSLATTGLTITGATSSVSNTSGDITINSTSNNVAFSGDNLINIGNITAAGSVLWGNSATRTETRTNAGLRGDAGAVSGFFQNDGSTVTNYPTGASGWWHLIDVRHSNNANNYAMQFAGSFFDQNLYFRKTNDNPATGWSKIVMENASGFVGIGDASPSQKLSVAGNIAKTGSFIMSDSWGAGSNGGLAVHTSAWDGSSNNNYGYIVGGHGYLYTGLDIGSGSGFEAGAGQLYVQGISKLNGSVGIGTTNPQAKLEVVGPTTPSSGNQTFNNTSTGRVGSTQVFTAPVTGSYVITAVGAAGGYSNGGSIPGGKGASMQGTFNLNAGEVISIMVGQKGIDYSSTDRGGGGGGGTFVVNKSSNTLLIAAGGGGGGGQYNSSNKDAVTTTSGVAGYNGGAGGTSGNGGNGSSYGAGGAGYSGNGGNPSNLYAYPGTSFTNGGNGGVGYRDGSTPTMDGGYGGGGGAYAGGGGGGGYSGGGGGGWSMSGEGGGGGSYNAGTSQNNVAASNSGQGSVTISWNGTAYGTAAIFTGNVGVNINSPAYSMTINGSGYLGSAGWIYGSDRALKTNIQYYSDSGIKAVDLLTQLKPASFDYKNGVLNEDGFIAQDVQTVIPDLVVPGVNGMLALKTNGFIPYLVKGIQEQQTDILSLTSQIQTLTGKVTDLSTQVTALDSKVTVVDGKVQNLDKDLSITQNGQVAVNYNVTDTVLKSLGYDGTKNEIETAQYKLTSVLGQVVTRVSQFGEIAAAKINTGLLSAKNVVADNIVSKVSISQQIKTDFISPLSGTVTIDGNATISGSLAAKDIKSNNATFSGNLTANNASISGILAAYGINVDTARVSNMFADHIYTDKFSDFGGDVHVAGQISSGKATADQINAGVITSNDLFSNNLFTNNLAAPVATFSTVYADNIISKEGTIGDLMADKISALRAEIQAIVAAGTTTPVTQPTDSKLLVESENWSMSIASDSAQIKGDLALSDNLVVGAKLTVSGDTTMGNAFITGTLAAGEIMIKDNFIETTNTALYIQGSGMGSVHILGDTLVIADTGDVTINGNLGINGRLTANEASISGSLFANLLNASEASISGKLAAAELETNQLRIATDSAQTIIAESGFAALATSSAEMMTNATAGTATLPAGKTELIIRNPKLTAQSMVYLTPVGSTQNQVLYVKSKFISPTPTPESTESATPTSSFTIALDQALGQNIEINWWIIN